MNKELRDKVYNKYNGRCAYTGKPLGDDWQVDHAYSKYQHDYHKIQSDVNDISNLMPALRIVNHYKRELSIEGFRWYLKDFHLRLSKLPKKTRLDRTKKRIAYMEEVANAFNITINKPFSGKFYFETIK